MRVAPMTLLLALTAFATAALAQEQVPKTPPAPPVASSPDQQAQVRQVAESPLGLCIRKPPEYPHEALRKEMSGRSLLVFTVTPEGTIEKPGILRSSGHGVLDRAALAHLEGCIANLSPGDGPQLPPGRFSLPLLWVLE